LSTAKNKKELYFVTAELPFFTWQIKFRQYMEQVTDGSSRLASQLANYVLGDEIEELFLDKND